MVVYGLIGVILIAFIVILVLNKVISTLERLVAERPALAPEEAVGVEGRPAVPGRGASGEILGEGILRAGPSPDPKSPSGN